MAAVPGSEWGWGLLSSCATACGLLVPISISLARPVTPIVQQASWPDPSAGRRVHWGSGSWRHTCLPLGSILLTFGFILTCLNVLTLTQMQSKWRKLKQKVSCWKRYCFFTETWPRGQLFVTGAVGVPVQNPPWVQETFWSSAAFLTLEFGK